MRDIAVTLIVFGSLPLILWRPWIGAMMWIWLSVLNPHRLSWGFAMDMPFAQVVALVTFAGIVFSAERRKFPWCSVTVALFVMCVWMTVTTVFALHSEAAWVQWNKVIKIQLMNFVVLHLMNTRDRLQWMVWVTTLSMGLLGIKGGLFTLTGGGADRVFGPKGTFIEENNQLALATIMVIPMMYYLSTLPTKRWQRRGLLLGMLLCVFSAVGSHSRGALLAMIAMGMFLVMKSRHRFSMLLAVAAFAPILWYFMPEHWTSRMETIDDYQQDASSMGRINAWTMAFNLALDRPIVGGGFETWTYYAFGIWAPNPQDVHSSHSNYFQFLGEHGWPGLFIFLTVLYLAWRMASSVIARSKLHPDLTWYGDLCRMVQVSVMGYSVGGAFVNLGYFDLPYFLIAMIVLAHFRIQEDIAALQRSEKLSPLRSGAVAGGRRTVPATGATVPSGQQAPRFRPNG